MLTLDLLFATPVALGRLDDAALVASLAEAAGMREGGDEAGAGWCETEGYDGYTSYASLDDLPKRATAFADLVRRLDGFAADFAEARAWNMAGHRLALDSLWVNILGEGGAHSGHIHPNSVISGTVYVAMPQGAGAIRFEDPRLGLMMAAPPVRADAAGAERRFIHRTPEAGDVLLWESWLRHEVMPNRSEDPRITLSFNYSLADA